MSYTALYRKYRPATFDDVRGQDHISRTLRNQVNAGRVGHAYLFCGTRGTGKTSVAKILAKAVNCEHPVNGSPCGKCASCLAIQSGESMNVLEIDAASNNGVDNIRDIREEVAYRPAGGRYKVYIIDEVHMLSTTAANALLKTLEEPPGYVIFILATTEVQKIPVTIRSRCQRYDFRRISTLTIAERITEILGLEGIDSEKRAVDYIARAADGSMRDALSLLDQCISFYMGQKVTYDHVLEILGTVDLEVFGNLFRQILSRDVAALLATVGNLINEGRDIGQTVTDFTWYLRNLLLLKCADGADGIIDVSAEDLSRMKKEAALTDTETLIRYIRVFSELINRLRYEARKRTVLEVALIRLCRPEMEEGLDGITDRLRDVERRLDEAERGVFAVKEAVNAADKGAGGPRNEAADMQKSGREGAAEGPGVQVRAERVAEGKADGAGSSDIFPKALHEDVKAAAENFRAIAEKTTQPLRSCLKSARLSVGDKDELLLVFPDEISAKTVEQKDHMQELMRCVKEQTGKTVDIQVRYLDDTSRFGQNYVDLESLVHMPVSIDD